MVQVTVRNQGNSVGITFPAETRVRMGLEVGQKLTLVELQDGIKLVKHDGLDQQLEVARRILKGQADILKGFADFDKT